MWGAAFNSMTGGENVLIPYKAHRGEVGLRQVGEMSVAGPKDVDRRGAVYDMNHVVLPQNANAVESLRVQRRSLSPQPQQQPQQQRPPHR